METRDPRVRAPLTKAILELLEDQPPVVQRAVREQAATAVRHVEEATRVSWIPLGTQLEILRVLRDAVGTKGYEDFCALHFSSTVDQPLIKGVFDTTVRLFGVGPGPVYRMFPKAWGMMTRGCGSVDMDGSPHPSGTHMVVSELPVEEPNIDLFVQGFGATFRGVLDLFKVTGEVERGPFDAEARIARYVVTWS